MTTFRALNFSQLGLNYCALLLDECLGDNHLCLSSCSVVLPPKSGRGEIDCAYVVLATRWWQQVPSQNEHSIIHAKLKRPSSFICAPLAGAYFLRSKIRAEQPKVPVFSRSSDMVSGIPNESDDTTASPPRHHNLCQPACN